MTATITLFNQAGGVGKSTLTLNLGYHLADLGQKVLLVDMDPQASLTVFIGLEPGELEETIYDAIINDRPLPIHTGLHGLDVVPANVSLCDAEQELVTADMRDVRLRDALSEVKDDYDYILIDCPPSLGLLSYVSLVAASHILIPIQTEYKALRGTELLVQTIARVKRRANRKLKVAGIVPTMHKTRTVQSEASLETITTQLSAIGPIFETVPRATDFANASQVHKPLGVFQPRHPAVKILQKIASQLDEQL